jgi:hypothetical protein
MNTKKLGLFAAAAMAASFSSHAQTVQWDFTSGLLTGTSDAAPPLPPGPCGSDCGVTPTFGIITGEVDATNGSVTSFNFNFNGVNYGTNNFSYSNIGGGVTGSGTTTENTFIPNLSLFTPTNGPDFYGVTGYIDLSSGAPIVNLAVSANTASITYDLVINSTGTRFGLDYADVAAGIGCGYYDSLITAPNATVLNPCSMQVSSTTPGTWKTPELDPSSAASELTLLLGALLVLRGRRERVLGAWLKAGKV